MHRSFSPRREALRMSDSEIEVARPERKRGGRPNLLYVDFVGVPTGFGRSPPPRFGWRGVARGRDCLPSPLSHSVVFSIRIRVLRGIFITSTSVISCSMSHS